MRSLPAVSPDAFWTSHSLVLPFTESTHSVGGYLVGIRAQTEDIVVIVKDWLGDAYEQKKSSEIRAIVKFVIDHAEAESLPLACHILGKA